MKCPICSWPDFVMWLKTPVAGDDIKAAMDELRPVPRVNTESIVMSLYCARCRVLVYNDVRGWLNNTDIPLEWDEEKKALIYKRSVVLHEPVRGSYQNTIAAPEDIFTKSNIDKLMSLIAEIKSEQQKV